MKVKDRLTKHFGGWNKGFRNSTKEQIEFINPQGLSTWREMQKRENDVEHARDAEKKGSRYKVIISGHIIELYEYEIPVKTAMDRPENPPKKERKIDEETGEILSDYDPVEGKKQNARRARYELMRLVSANFSENARFVTFTFRDGSVNDVTSVKDCNAAFKQFIQRMRRRYGSFKYIKVIEFQDRNDRGAVHYHVIWDLPYINAKKISKLWGNGYIRINKIDHVDNVGVYVTKYMVKNFDDPRLKGEKAYSTSKKNLIRPDVVYGKDALELMAAYMLDERKAVFDKQYDGGEYCGNITYKQFNLRREGD